MSTHAPDPFTFFPFRKGDAKEPEWSVLIRYVKQHFPSNFNSQVQGSIDRLTQYKKVIAVTCTNDLKQPPNEAFIEQTLKPYVQLIATAQAHLPLYGDAIKGLSFEWRDSLDEGFKHQSKNSNVEVFSCLYNIAAAYTYTASVDAESGTVDGIKNAFKTYQTAAGCYQAAECFLKRLPAAALVKDATVEVQSALQKLCMCQAHHCSYLKAEIEMKGKHVLLSKMAVEGGKLYEDAAKTIAAQSWAKSTATKDLETYANNLSLLFFARGHLHLAGERMEIGEVGDAIARYNHANVFLQRTVRFSNGNMNAWMAGIKTTVTEMHSKAVSANETVYFLRIPKELPALEGLGKGLGKPTPAQQLTKVTSSRDTDPFFGIVPAHIAEVARKHFNSMQQLASTCSKSVAHYREQIRTALNKMGVTATIESLSNETKDQGRVPEPLRTKILAMRPAEGGSKLIEGLVNSVNQSEELRDAILGKLENIRSALHDEQKEDEAMATQYGATLWRGYRPPSLLTPHAQEIQKMLLQQQEQLAKYVNEPLTQIKSVLSSSLKELSRLDWPMDDLDALMPYTKTKAIKEQTKVVMENVDKLKKLTARFDQIDEVNNTKLQDLNALLQSDAVVHSLSAVDADQHEAILDAASNEVKDLISCIQSNVSSGEALLECVDEVMGTLAVTRSEDPTAVEIQKVCNMIETAMDLFQRVKQDDAELNTCASQSLEAVEGILSSAQSFALSRTLEADDIKANIEAQISAKVKEMEQKRSTDATIQESQSRQEILKAELQQLEHQRAMTEQQRAARAHETAAAQQSLAHQAADVNRNERMQQLLNKQREAAYGPNAGVNPSQPVPPPPAYPPPPPMYQQYAQGPPPTQSSAPSAGSSSQGQQPLYSNFTAQSPPPQQQQYGQQPPPPQQQQYGQQQPPQYAQPMQQAPQFNQYPPAPLQPQQQPPGNAPYMAQLPHPSTYHYQPR